MPNPGFEPGTFDAAAGFPSRYTAWLANSINECFYERRVFPHEYCDFQKNAQLTVKGNHALCLTYEALSDIKRLLLLKFYHSHSK